MPSEKIITLFDEYGTPTLKRDRENKLFIGVAVSYRNLDEKIVFDKVEDLIGLKNNKPLKNTQISTNRAIRIAEAIIPLPLYIVVTIIDLSNRNFIETITEYHQVTNKVRNNGRNIRDRPIAQIIHSKVLSNCLFESITLCLEMSSNLNKFDVFIDNWSIPFNYISSCLKFRSESLSKHIGNLFPNVDIKPIELLVQDTKRKRFIDSVVSVVSRNYHHKSNDKYSNEPFDLLFSSESINSISVDITEKETEIMNKMLEELSKKG